jgi:hypothetical protein
VLLTRYTVCVCVFVCVGGGVGGGMRARLDLIRNLGKTCVKRDLLLVSEET